MNWTKDWAKYEGQVFIVKQDNTIVRGELIKSDTRIRPSVAVLRDDNGELEWHHPAYVFPCYYEEDWDG